MDGLKLLAEYERGAGFRRGDVIRAKEGAALSATVQRIGGVAVVLSQSKDDPYQYWVVGEVEGWTEPHQRFAVVNIHGHMWEVVNQAPQQFQPGGVVFTGAPKKRWWSF